MSSDERFRRDVDMLNAALNEVLVELAGAESAHLVGSVRGLAERRRAGDDEAAKQLSQTIASCSLDQLRVTARALSVYFDLLNLAEDRQRVRVLRERERRQHPEPRGESVADAIGRLRKAGVSAESLARLIRGLDIELVFTAHPTEAKRRSIRDKLRRLRELVRLLDTPEILPSERDRAIHGVRGELCALWQTDFLRLWRPTVRQEVERALSFAPTLFQVAPLVLDDLRRALVQHYPGHGLEAPAIPRFGSWIGGDRDGNPNVTADVTADTLAYLRGAAIDFHLARCEQMQRPLSVSERRAGISQPVKDAIQRACERWPELEDRLASISPREVYRQWLSVIEWRLEHTKATPFLQEPIPCAYGRASEFRADLALIQESLQSHHGDALATGDLQVWLDQVSIFGLYLARLDVRQESGQYRSALAEIFSSLGIADGYLTMSEGQRQEILARTMPFRGELPIDDFSTNTREVLRLFRLLARTIRVYGPEVIGGHVVSLTRDPSDLLGPLWLWQWAKGKYLNSGEDAELALVPLFETLHDLINAPKTLTSLLEHPLYAAHLERRRRQQMVMVGYSDSTKDAGYVAAVWAIHKAQVELAQVARRFNVELVFFHGRGGSLGRGGGPAARAILSLPPSAVDGRFRITEQGEVLAERYDDPEVARRHLEQVTWATLLVSALPPPPPKEHWVDLMDRLAAKAATVYRRLVDDESFLEYFALATPIEEIENLPIGSRPSRRRGQRTLKDLRAIPWVFSWTQSRNLLPAWYGLGSALEQATAEDWLRMQEMYRDWPLVTAMIDNAALALAKADLDIAHAYARLVEDPTARQKLFGMIQAEYARSEAAVLKILNAKSLLDKVPWLDRSIRSRNPYVDPLNLIQIELIRRLRGLDADAPDKVREPLRDLVRLTIQGIASGLRTTG